MSASSESLERNLRLYAWFLPLSRVYFWTPVFFLYLSERFPISEVLQLEAIYYAVVVLLELPSGYFSDRIGRRATLIISTCASTTAFALFLAGGTSFALFAVAEAAKAVGFAFLSGTDTSFHYDSLRAVGREHRFAEREAKLSRNGFWGAALAAAAGGAVGMWDLRLAYALALANAVVLVVLAVSLREPPRHVEGYASRSFFQQLGACAACLRRPFLLWLFAYFVLKTTMEHIPYEFAQPYLAGVLGETIEDLRQTPIVSGLLVAGIAVVASVAAAYSVRMRDTLGLGPALLSVGGLQLALIGSMAAVLSPFIVPLLLLRSVQGAVSNPLINAAVAPLVAQDKRATFLSLHSLAGRMGYSAVLLWLSLLAGAGAVTDPSVLPSLLRAGALISLAGLIALALSRWVLHSDSQET